jgi:hypothetical protein
MYADIRIQAAREARYVRLPHCPDIHGEASDSLLVDRGGL